MKIIEFNPEVLLTNDDVAKVTAKDLEFLKTKSLNNERKRIRLCVHRNLKDQVHEMIIVHGKDAYVRPHKHLGRSESLHVIEGEAYAFLFDEDGKVSDIIHMGDKNSGRTFYYRISKAVYHSLIAVSDFFIFHEAVEGPFDKSKTIFAPWSPEDSELDKIKEFTKTLSNKLTTERI